MADTEYISKWTGDQVDEAVGTALGLTVTYKAFSVQIEASSFVPSTEEGSTYVSYTIPASAHGQMLAGVTANDLWVNYNAVADTAFPTTPGWIRYTIETTGDVTIYASSAVTLVVRIWNGIGFIKPSTETTNNE